jgi:hypothetical protein
VLLISVSKLPLEALSMIGKTVSHCGIIGKRGREGWGSSKRQRIPAEHFDEKRWKLPLVKIAL